MYQAWGRSSVVERGTFNAEAEGSIPSALTHIIAHNLLPTAHAFPACLLLVIISDSRLLCLHDRQARGTPSPYQGNRRRNNQSALDSLFFRDSSFPPLYDNMSWRLFMRYKHHHSQPNLTST